MKHISSYIQQGRLKSKTSIDLLQSLWLRAAPTGLQQICTPRRYTDNCLTLEVASSIWLSRLRQQQATLLRQLRRTREFATLREIRLQVVPKQHKTGHNSKPVKQQRFISSSSAELLRSTATHIKHAELQQSLERLADTAARKKEPDD